MSEKRVLENNKIYELIVKNTTNIDKNLENIQKNSYALEILKDFKTESKRLFVALIIVLCMWFATIGIFIYYISTTGYEVTTETAETSDSGNACVGEYCNNGEISYGKGN